MKEPRLAKLLVIMMIMAFLVSAGAVGCCPWAGPGPAPGGPPPGGELQLVLMANPDMVPPGGCTMLHWEVAPPGEYRVLLNGQQVPLVGDQQVCPPGTMTYELRVETPGGPQVRSVTVNVGGGPGGGPLPPTPGGGPVQPPTPGLGPPPTAGPGEGCAGPPTFTYFTASASTISAGQQVQLSWGEVRNGTSGPLVRSVVLSPGGFGEVGSPGSRWASPTTTTTYRLTATGCGGTATKDVTVTVGGAGTAATSTPHPGGATATKQSGGPTATKPAAGPTVTPTTAVILGTVIPFVPAATPTVLLPTATAAPVWGECSWVGVEQAGLDTHIENVTFCPSGTFLTGLDLDRDDDWYDENSPTVGAAECCALATAQSSGWGACMWVQVGNLGMDSLLATDFCPDGSYVTGLRTGADSDWDPYLFPVFSRAECCTMAGYLEWDSCSWVGVNTAGIDSHAPETWCPNGSFVVGLDLDGDWNRDPMDSPVIGQAHCCTARFVQREPG